MEPKLWSQLVWFQTGDAGGIVTRIGLLWWSRYTFTFVGSPFDTVATFLFSVGFLIGDTVATFLFSFGFLIGDKHCNSTRQYVECSKRQSSRRRTV